MAGRCFREGYLIRGISVRLLSIFALFFLSLVPAGSVLAQAVANAGVSGQVTDQSGGAVSGATVKMTETEKGVPHTTTTDSDGRYTIPNLPVGPYRLEATGTGFKTYTQTGIVLQVGDHPAMDVKLEVGAVSETVEVTAGAAMVQMEQTSVSQV